jgi:hypothetical protein
MDLFDQTRDHHDKVESGTNTVHSQPLALWEFLMCKIVTYPWMRPKIQCIDPLLVDNRKFHHRLLHQSTAIEDPLRLYQVVRPEVPVVDHILKSKKEWRQQIKSVS